MTDTTTYSSGDILDYFVTYPTRNFYRTFQGDVREWFEELGKIIRLLTRLPEKYRTLSFRPHIGDLTSIGEVMLDVVWEEHRIAQWDYNREQGLVHYRFLREICTGIMRELDIPIPETSPRHRLMVAMGA